MKKIKKIIGPVLGLVMVVFATGLTAYRLQLLTGFPKGVDAYAHLTRIAWILTRFPQIHWNPVWNSGTFFWLWSYPPSNIIFTTAAVKILAITPEQAWNLVNFGCLVAFAIGFYLTLTSWAGSWLAIPIALLAVTTPALYSWWGHGGNYIRIWGMGFYGLTMAAFVFYLKKPKKLTYAVLIVLLALTLTAHMLFTALTLASLVGYILFAVKGVKNKLAVILKTVGVGVLLSSFWYIPMAATTSGSRFLEPSIGGPVAFADLFSLNLKLPYFSLPFSFAVVMVIAFLLAFWAMFLRQRSDRLIWGAVPAYALGLIGSLAYAFGRHFSWFPKSFSASGFAPFAAFPFIIIFTGFMAASTLGVILNRRKNSIWTILAALVASGAVIFMSLNIDFSKLRLYDMTRKGETQTLAIPPVKALNHDQRFRFGTDSAFVSDWFNYFYPNLPQTRDYIYQGIPYKSWQYFQEYSLWTQEGKYPEAEWLLDWYGVKYFTVGLASGATKFEKFLSRPDLFEKKFGNQKGGYFVFEYKKARPILTTTDAPIVLVIGDSQDYETFVRGLAMIGLGTEGVIPVYGGEKMGHFKGQLASFDALFLYRYQPSDSLGENSLISQYLKNGGQVLVEALPEEEVQIWPTWSPVSKSEKTEIKDRWDFSQIAEELKIKEKDFSPPSFKGDVWKVSRGQLNEGSNVLLAVQDQPVLVEKKVGQGQVVWSSLNLPYHAEDYRNEKEVGLLIQLLGIEKEPQKIGLVKLVKNEPQKRVWEVAQKAKGLVWKESWFPRWSISWTDSKGKKGKLASLMAGPALSYIILPQEAAHPLTLKANYHLVFWDYLGWGVTIITIILLIIYLFAEKFFQRFFKRFINLWSKMGTGWKEDE